MKRRKVKLLMVRQKNDGNDRLLLNEWMQKKPHTNQQQRNAEVNRSMLMVIYIKTKMLEKSLHSEESFKSMLCFPILLCL